MNQLTLKSFKHHSLLFISLALSLGLHLAGILFLTYNPMILHHSWKSLFGISSAAPDFLELPEEANLERKNKIMEEVFEHILVLSPHLQQPFDLVELPKGIALAPTYEASSPIALSNADDGFTEEEINAWTTPIASTPFDSENSPIDLLSLAFDASPLLSLRIEVPSTVEHYDIGNAPLPETNIAQLIEPSSVGEVNAAVVPEPVSHLAGIAQVHLSQLMEQTELEADAKMLPIQTALELAPSEEQAPLVMHPPSFKVNAPSFTVSAQETNLDDYFLNALPLAAEWNDAFDMTIKFLPNPEQEGYIFSVQLTPQFDVAQYSLKHDILFVVDRTTSVQKHRFSVYKRAVIKALASMQKGDTFNIYLVDKKITRMHSLSLAVSPKNIQAAEDFLEKHEQADLFGQSDILTSLEKILPDVQDESIVHTAILITDGKMPFNTQKQQQVLSNWMSKNSGRLSVYTAAVGDKNDFVMLDFLSSISGGKLLWSDTHASFPRKLAKLVLDLRDPVAQDLIIEAIPHNPQARVAICPDTFHRPALFSRKPYEIIGTIDQPGPFDLIVQGRHRDEWIAIKKTVSFVDGEKGDRSLVNQWSGQKTHACYAKFIKDGKVNNLKEAKELLKQSHSELAFE